MHWLVATILLMAKGIIAHGNVKGAKGWKRYVEEKCGIPYRTAAMYVRIAEHRDLWRNDKSATMADLGVVGLGALVGARLKAEELFGVKGRVLEAVASRRATRKRCE